MQMFKKDMQAGMGSDRRWKCHGDLEWGVYFTPISQAAPHPHPSSHSWKHSI